MRIKEEPGRQPRQRTDLGGRPSIRSQYTKAWADCQAPPSDLAGREVRP